MKNYDRSDSEPISLKNNNELGRPNDFLTILGSELLTVTRWFRKSF